MRSFVIGLSLAGLSLAPASAPAQVNPYGSSGKGKIYGLDLSALQGPDSAPARIVIVMDFSGSMAGQSGDGTWFNVITFESEPHPWQPSLVEATDEIKDEAKDYFDDLEPTGGTAMIPALEEAFAEGPDFVILVSDGVPNEGPQAVLDRVTELNADDAVTVHTIGIGQDLDLDFMKTLAEQNGGEMYERGTGIL